MKLEDFWLQRDECRQKTYPKMIAQIDKYWDKLFADPIDVHTPDGICIIVPQRTNNILEGFFRGEKRQGRTNTGTASLPKTLKTILADTPLVRNLGGKILPDRRQARPRAAKASQQQSGTNSTRGEKDDRPLRSTRENIGPIDAQRQHRCQPPLAVIGPQFFPAVFEAVDRARYSMRMEMYLIESGRVATKLVCRLVTVARRGIEVQLLLDGFGARGLSSTDRRRLIQGGVDLVFFNPPGFVRLERNVFRTHRKLLLVDDRIAFLEGWHHR